MSVEDVGTTFVDGFPGSMSRGDILRRWKQFSDLIRGTVDVEHEYLDGSFVTTRPNPADVDLSCWITADNLNALPLAKQRYMSRLLSQASAYRCDAYIVPVCSNGHPDYPSFVHMKNWTERYWRSYKKASGAVVDGVHKGYVEVMR